MSHEVWACEVCGEESKSEVETCPICGGTVEKVDPVFVAVLDVLAAVLRPAEPQS